MPDDRIGCEHVPPRFAQRFLDSFDASAGRQAKLALAAVRRLVAGEVGSVLLSGPVGAGKSHLAAAACNELAAPLEDVYVAADAALAALRSPNVELAERYGRGPDLMEAVSRARRRLDRQCPRWIGVPSLLGRLRRDMNARERPAEAEMAGILTARGLLVIDDLGAERASEWSLAVLFELVDSRYLGEIPLLVTSNLTAGRLAGTDLGYERIVSRLADGGALVDMVGARDYRVRGSKRALRSVPGSGELVS